MTEPTTDPTPDQHASGTRDGNHWSIARYGTLVVVSADDNGDEADDIQLATEADAVREFNGLADAWSTVD